MTKQNLTSQGQKVQDFMSKTHFFTYDRLAGNFAFIHTFKQKAFI